MAQTRSGQIEDRAIAGPVATRSRRDHRDHHVPVGGVEACVRQDEDRPGLMNRDVDKGKEGGEDVEPLKARLSLGVFRAVHSVSVAVRETR